MERSRNWPRIKGRLNAIIHLQETLDTEFLIARFRPNLVRIHCKIDAEYIIKNLHSGEVFLVFIDKGTGQRYYCKSAFERTTIDYLENKAVLTVLKKEKVINGIPTLLYLLSLIHIYRLLPQRDVVKPCRAGVVVIGAIAVSYTHLC